MNIHLKKFIYFIMIFILAVRARSECLPNPIQRLSGQVQQSTCDQIKKDPICQDLYKEIKSNKEKIEDFEPNCSASSSEIKLTFQIAIACSIGAYDSLFGQRGRQIVNAVTDAVLDAQKSEELDKTCNSSIENKKKVYALANLQLPKILQLSIPSGDTLKNKTCNDIYQRDIMGQVNRNYQSLQIDIETKKYSHQIISKDELDFLDWKKKNNPDVSMGEEAQQATNYAKNVYAAAVDYLVNAGIQIKCYNSQKRSDLICSALASIAEEAVSGYGAYNLLIKSSGIKMLHFGKASAHGELVISETTELAEAAKETSVPLQLEKQSIEKSSISFSQCDPSPCSIKSINYQQDLFDHLKPHLEMSSAQKEFVSQAADYINANPGASRSKIEKYLKQIGPYAREEGSATPFRRTETTFFPKNADPKDLLAELPKLKVKEFPNEGSTKVFDVEKEGVKYRIHICNDDTCRRGSEIIHRGDVATIYPRCGPGVVKLVQISEAVNIASKPPVSASSFLKDVPCK